MWYEICGMCALILQHLFARQLVEKIHEFSLRWSFGERRDKSPSLQFCKYYTHTANG